MNVEQLATHIRIEEGIRLQDGGKDYNPSSSTINMVEGDKAKIKGKKRFGKFTQYQKGKKAKVENDENCFECNKPGHFKKDCSIWKRKMKEQKNQSHGQSSRDKPFEGICAQINNNSEMNFIAMIYEINYVQDDIASWWIDSGASRHVCNDRRYFKTFKEIIDGNVLYMGNESTVKIQGIGQVELLFTS
ncbi:hypothetical protein RND81_01G052000 [Saponaria officinalis]|uniref:CCHC-type domain-containing protein n=1 Tax=Saponaria officinalis TaxID=3572 RepID=A0AAW1N615_SAPOF